MAKISNVRKVRTYQTERDGIKEIRVYMGRELEFIAYRSECRYLIEVCKGGYAGFWLNAEPKTEAEILTACKEFYNAHTGYIAA